MTRLTVRVMPPAAPENVRALWYWDEDAGETEADARRISFIEPSHTSWTIPGLVSGHQYAFRMNASNLAGVSPPSNTGRHVVY